MNNNFNAQTGALGAPARYTATHPIDVEVAPALTHRNRLTVAFRPLLALPHILLVGGPVAFATSLWWRVRRAVARRVPTILARLSMRHRNALGAETD